MASDRSGAWRHAAEALAIPIGALAAAMVVFGIFTAALGQNPLEIYALIYQGAFASAFSWQNTLSRAAPLVLTALCVALPAQAGLMVIGGEGAVVLGGLAAAVAGHLLSGAAPIGVKATMAFRRDAWSVRLWIALAGALRQYRGVGQRDDLESCCSLTSRSRIFNHFVEGPVAGIRRASTSPRPRASAAPNMLGNLPGPRRSLGARVRRRVSDSAMYVLVRYTTYGFSLRIVGGNPRGGRLAGLPVGALVSNGLPPRRRRRGALPARSRSPRSTARPTPR
jgi:simple sugar transport system permease protein